MKDRLTIVCCICADINIVQRHHTLTTWLPVDLATTS